MKSRRSFDSDYAQPSTTAAFAAKATDLQALRDAVVDAASVGGALWISYLGVFFYLAIAAGAVTHRDLFLTNPVNLPFLNVQLPLRAFFVLGPLLFLIMHAYTLLHFTLFADKVGAFHNGLQAQMPDNDKREALRRQLPSNIFVQFLAGPGNVRHGVVGWMLRAIALTTLVIGPILLLVFFELQFLPYHSKWISWWQRGTVVIDLALLWTLWPSIACGSRFVFRWRDLVRVKILSCFALSLLPALLIFTIATYPGEWLDDRFQTASVIQPLRKLLVAGDVDPVLRRPESLWSNVLVLPGFDAIDHTKFDTDAQFASVASTISLRGRNLNGAVLIGAYLRKGDFTGASLNRANLGSADLRGASLGCGDVDIVATCTQLQEAELSSAQLQDADLLNAQLQRATLTRTQLQHSDLSGAQLQRSDLSNAQLQNASLVGAQLYRADLAEAQLQGSDLNGAQLERTFLGSAQLQGADFTSADLQGATLGGAQLQGAKFVGAQLLGANLAAALAAGADFDKAQLQAAFLYNAQLQGVTLEGAQLQGAFLNGASLQGADLQGAQLQGAALNSVSLQGADLDGAQLQDAGLTKISVWRALTKGMNATGTYITDPNLSELSGDDFQRLQNASARGGDTRRRT